MKINIGWVVIGGFAIWLFTKIRAGLGLTFTPRGFSFQGASLVIQLGVFNPSLFPLQLNGFNGYLTVNGQPVGIINDTSPASLASRAETPIQVAFSPNIGVLITDIVNYFSSKSSAVIGIQGTANVENLNVPINQSLTVAAL